MDLSDFDYALPDELIAQEPLADRAASRMLVVHRNQNRWEDRAFRDLPEFLGPGDCLALNDSRVFPARLFGHRAGVRSMPIGMNNPKRREYLSGRVEVFLLRPVSADRKDWQALVRPGRKMRLRERIEFDGGLAGEIVGRGEFGERVIRFDCAGDPFAEFERIGHVPLPPYIKRSDNPADRERYQTVFAREKGSVAAPTAGLHFTPELLDECRARGADTAYVTLHVGLGTFQPLHEELVETAKLHSEQFRITEENAARMRAARRLIPVGHHQHENHRERVARWPHGSPLRRNRYLHLPRLRVPRRRRPPHQLPPAAHQPAPSGLRLRRNQPDVSRLPPRRRADTGSTPTAIAC